MPSNDNKSLLPFNKCLIINTDNQESEVSKNCTKK